jgi:hypothetical protein
LNLARRSDLLAAVLLAMLAFGCAETVPMRPQRVAEILEQATAAAQAHLQASQDFEAAQLLTAVDQVDPSFPAAQPLRARIPDDLLAGEHPTALGSNVAFRPPTARAIATRILLYLPDRIFDLLDIVSFEARSGLGGGAEVHLTRAGQLGLESAYSLALGWFDHRALGARYQVSTTAGLGPYASRYLLIGGGSTAGLQLVMDQSNGTDTPFLPLYQEFRDYWAVGASAMAIVYGLAADVHPVEIADFLAGFVLADFLRDDFATTRGLQLSDTDKELLKRMHEVESSPQMLDAYRVWSKTEGR